MIGIIIVKLNFILNQKILGIYWNVLILTTLPIIYNDTIIDIIEFCY